MKYAIISDIHSNLQALEAALKEIKKIGVDSIICLGDIVGYNANPSECISLIKNDTKFTYRVKGNHDITGAKGLDGLSYFEINEWSQDAIDGLRLTDFILNAEDRKWILSAPETLEIKDSKMNFFISHYSPAGRDSNFGYVLSEWDANTAMRYLRAKNINLGFFGHTHVPTTVISKKSKVLFEIGSHVCNDTIEIYEDRHYLVNPGSIGQPRKNGFVSFAIFDTEKMTIDFVPFTYNIQKAKDAIMKAPYKNPNANIRLSNRLI
jgi:predicted phosphodiesterase